MLKKKIKFIKFKRFIFPILGYFLINLLDKSTRFVKFNEPDNIKTPKIYALWHGRQYCLLKLQPRNNLNVLVSQSNDGEIIAAILSKLGYNLIRGSASRGGFKAAKEMLKAIKSGEDIAFTVDGPRGPLYSLNPSLFRIAQSSGATIIPLVSSVKNKLIFNSWDKYTVPFYFSTFNMYFGTPFIVNKGLSKEQLSEIINKFEREIKSLTLEADQTVMRNQR